VAGHGEYQGDGDRLPGAQLVAQAGQQNPVRVRRAGAEAGPGGDRDGDPRDGMVTSTCAVADPAAGAGMRALMTSMESAMRVVVPPGAADWATAVPGPPAAGLAEGCEPHAARTITAPAVPAAARPAAALALASGSRPGAGHGLLLPSPASRLATWSRLSS
jgi:hypothetical protein